MLKKVLFKFFCDSSFHIYQQQDIELKVLWMTMFFQYMECSYCGDRNDIELIVVAHDSNIWTRNMHRYNYWWIHKGVSDFIIWFVKKYIWLGGMF